LSSGIRSSKIASFIKLYINTATSYAAEPSKEEKCSESCGSAGEESFWIEEQQNVNMGQKGKKGADEFHNYV